MRDSELVQKALKDIGPPDKVARRSLMEDKDGDPDDEEIEEVAMEAIGDFEAALKSGDRKAALRHLRDLQKLV